MSHASILNLGLTAISAVVVMMLIFAVLRLSSAAKGARQRLRDTGSEAALLSVALQDAVSKLKAQEHAMSSPSPPKVERPDRPSLAAGLLVVDRDGRVEILNPAGHRMLGTPGNVGRDYRAFLATPSCSADRALSPTSAGAAADPRSRGEVTSLRSLCRRSRRPVRQGAICLFSDLTQMLELEDQLRLKEALARVGSSRPASPTSSARAGDHPRLQPPDSPRRSAHLPPYVDGIRQETEALGHVVTNFLKFARPEQVVSAEVDLDAIVRRAVDELTPELPDTTVEVRGHFGAIEGDEVLLRQVFGNLVRNAAEACQASGVAPRIDIWAGRRPHLPHHGGRQRAGRARAVLRQDLPAVLHHAVARHRPGPAPRSSSRTTGASPWVIRCLAAPRFRSCSRSAPATRKPPPSPPSRSGRGVFLSLVLGSWFLVRP
jgi:hypothetical protein